MNGTGVTELEGVEGLVDKPSPHWMVLVLNISLLFSCTILGTASACSALYEILSRRTVRSIHWPTVVLMTTAVYVCAVVAPLESAHILLHHLHTPHPSICVLQLFSHGLCDHLGFIASIVIAIGRVRKIHSPYQTNPSDLLERLLMGVSTCVAIPSVILLCYSCYENEDLYITYQFCMKQDFRIEPAITGLERFLGALCPAHFFITITTVVCVFMKGVWTMKKRICRIASSGGCGTARAETRDSISPQHSPVQRCSYVPRDRVQILADDPMFSRSEDNISVSSGPIVTNIYRQNNPGVLPATMDSRCPTPARKKSGVSSFTNDPPRLSECPTSGLRSSVISNPLTNSVKSGTYSDNVESGMEATGFSRSEPKMNQYSVHRALKKVSKVSMMSVETIPEMLANSDQGYNEIHSAKVLQPLRHSRRSVGNVWHSDTTIDNRNSSGFSSTLKRLSKKNRKKRMKNLSSASHTSSCSFSRRKIRGEVDPSASVGASFQQQYNRRMSARSEESSFSNLSNVSCFTADGLDIGHCNWGRDSVTNTQPPENPGDTPESYRPKTESSTTSLIWSVDDDLVLQEHTDSAILGGRQMTDSPSQSGPKSEPSIMDNYIVGTSSGQTTSPTNILRRSQSKKGFCAEGLSVDISNIDSISFTEPKVDATTQTDGTDNITFKNVEMDDTVLELFGVQQSETPAIRIIRPSLPGSALNSAPKLKNRRRLLRNNWFSASPSTSVNGPVANEGLGLDRSNKSSGLLANSRDSKLSCVTMNSLRSSASSLFVTRYQMDIKRLLRRSLLLIGTFLVCFLPKALVHLCVHAMSGAVLANAYPSALTFECLYFTLAPVLYVYTNVSLMKMMKKKAWNCGSFNCLK